MSVVKVSRRRWVVAIPGWHPTPKNKLKAGRHWAIGHRLKKQDARTVGLCVRGAGVPDAGGRRSVELVITLGKGQRGCDPDAYWLSLLDALKLCGAIKGDSREHVHLLPVRYERAARMSATIILTDMADVMAACKPPGRPRRGNVRIHHHPMPAHDDAAA